MVLDATLLNTQYYKVRVKWSNMEYRPPLHLSVVAIEKWPFGPLSTEVTHFTFNFT